MSPEEKRRKILDALARLAEVNARQARIVELRLFRGLTEEKTAEVLNIPVRTAKREWCSARAWLHRQLGDTAE